jgi:hypothetical protein
MKEYLTMTDLNQAMPPVTVPREGLGLVRVAGWCAYASGVVSIFGIVFLVAFFAGVGGKFGTLNDVAVIIQYVLMLPIAVALWRYLQPDNERLSHIAFLIGMVGILTVIALQTLLVANLIPFQSYIVIVSAGFLVATAWFVITGIVGRAAGKLPNGLVLDILAGLYVGYPIWAFRLGHRLRLS